MPSILNEKGFADLIGGGLEGMINQDNIGKLIGSTMKDVSSVDNERLIAERQNDELRREIKVREEALEVLNAKLNEEELKEHQLKDKLHSIRVHSTSVKGETDKLRQENEEKKDELKCLQHEIKNLKRGLEDLDYELDGIKKTEKERLNAHKELKIERNTHKEALQKLEIEIQTCKASYEGLMQKWQEEIAEAAIKPSNPGPYRSIQAINLDSYSASTNYGGNYAPSRIEREPIRNNYLDPSLNVQYGGSVWRAQEPSYQANPSTLPAAASQFGSSKYASRYMSTDFKRANN